jgi:transglutaminase-like putative cysteine protease
MHDATIDHFAKIIGDPRPDEQPGREKRLLQRMKLLTHFQLAEGWFSFFLLAIVVYSTVWSVQAVGWVDHLDILTPITALGLLLGIAFSKQQRLTRVLAHALAFLLSLLLAFWFTVGADYAGNADAFLHHIRTWFFLTVAGGTSTDNSIFLFFILALGFLLAYSSTWLLYRTRSPWLMLIANAVILLINLSNVVAGYVVFLIIFLAAALLLLLRFNLYQSFTHWKRQGLRCSDGLSWEFMQAGSFISLGIMVFALVLPWGYINQQAEQVWSANNNPWVQAQNFWNRVFSVNGGGTPANHGNFTSQLALGGNPNLTNALVFQVKTTDGSQYLMYSSYDQYDGIHTWFNNSQDELPDKANTPFYDSTSYDLIPITQNITVVNPPGEQAPYLFGAPQIVSATQSAHLILDKSNDQVVAWLRDNGNLVAGNQYSVVSYVSDADVQTLRTIPMPQESAALPPGFDGQIPPNYFDPSTLAAYTRVPANLDPRIKSLAIQITKDQPTMYDKVAALESYLRTNYTYDSTITAPPPGVEATSWFLFQEKRGFCNYFATAMTLMARDLGIPARVAVGYTNGQFNAKTGTQDVNGTDAHAWTQVYFAGYGWINFEPSATFSQFTRPLASSSTKPVTVNPTGPSTVGNKGLKNRLPLPQDATGSAPVNTSVSAAGQVRLSVEIVLLVLVLLLLGMTFYFNYWWRRLFQHMSLPSQIFGRLCLLASWAGLSNKRSQTPAEYVQELSLIDPGEAVVFERLGDIYVRERWADPASSDHPSRTGEFGEVEGLWKTLQPRLMLYVLRHPHFLKDIPDRLVHLPHGFFRRPQRRSSTIAVEEHIDE